jgi:NAD(P)-dependent dehydrogenase (short-subunit alcohol dehydrogenase family)
MTSINLDGKVAIVTGSGGGLGREHALELARRGARVVVNDVGGTLAGEGGDEGPATRVVNEIEALGGEAVASTDSVATAEGGQSIVQTALDAFGTVDIVVNNAGVLRDKSFASMTPDLFTAVIEVHLLGAYYVTQPAFKVMKEKGYGRIVSTSSNSGILSSFGQANYGAAKMGLVGLTRVLSIEGRKYGIMVNAIAPVAKTRMTENLFGDMIDTLDPKLVSPLVAFLCSQECPVSGRVYSVAGGIVSRFLIGLTEGYYNPNLSAEDIAEHWDEVQSELNYIVPTDAGDELSKIANLIRGE